MLRKNREMKLSCALPRYFGLYLYLAGSLLTVSDNGTFFFHWKMPAYQNRICTTLTLVKFLWDINDREVLSAQRREKKHSKRAECLGVAVLTLAKNRVVQWIKLTETNNGWSLAWGWVPSGAECGWIGGTRRRGNIETPWDIFDQANLIA